MKRSYKKPVILFENMSLKAIIAACDYQLVNIGNGNSGIFVEGTGVLFFTMSACEITIEDGTCYHPPEQPEEWYDRITGGGTPATIS